MNQYITRRNGYFVSGYDNLETALKEATQFDKIFKIHRTNHKDYGCIREIEIIKKDGTYYQALTIGKTTHLIPLAA